MSKEKRAQQSAEQTDFVAAIRKTVETIEQRIREYDDKFTGGSIGRGRKRFQEYSDRYVEPAVRRGRDFVDQRYKKMSEFADEFLTRSRSVEKEARKKIDAFMEDGREFITGLPGFEMFENRVSTRIDRIPAMINLPGKTDIEKLTRAMESLNANLEALKKHPLG